MGELPLWQFAFYLQKKLMAVMIRPQEDREVVKIRMKEIRSWFFDGFVDKVMKVYDIERKSLEECFKEAYRIRYMKSYDVTRSFKFDDPDVDAQYGKWAEEYDKRMQAEREERMRRRKEKESALQEK